MVKSFIEENTNAKHGTDKKVGTFWDDINLTTMSLWQHPTRSMNQMLGTSKLRLAMQSLYKLDGKEKFSMRSKSLLE